MQSSRASASSRAAVRLLELGLLLMTPLVFYRGFAEQFTYIKLALTEGLVLVGAAGLALGLLGGRLRWPGNFRLGAPLGLLSLAVVCSCLARPLPTFSFVEAEYFLCGPLWLLLLYSWDKGESRVRWLAALGTIAGAGVAAVALLQWAGRDPLLFGGYQVEWGALRPFMRLYSTFGNPNFVAGYLIGGIFLALALAGTSKKIMARVAALAGAVIMFAAILGTRSHGAWLGLAAGLVIASVVWKRKEPGTPAATLKSNSGSVVQLSGWIFPIGVLAFVPDLLQQIQALLIHLEGRLYLARASWPMFCEHPLLGGGWGTFQLRFLDLQARFLETHPEYVRHWTHTRQLHNDPLQILLEAGAVGFVAFGWLLWTYAREVRRISAVSPCSIRLWLGASSGGVTAILADSLFNFQFASPPTLILLFTLMAFPGLLMPAGPQPEPPMRAMAPAGKRPWACALAGALGVMLAGLLMFQLLRRVQSELSMGRGLEQERRGDAVSAEQDFRAGLKRQPDDGRLRYGLARTLYLQERYSESLAEALKAERAIADSHLEVLKARSVDQLGFRSPARELYRHALWLDPTLKSVPGDIQRLTP